MVVVKSLINPVPASSGMASASLFSFFFFFNSLLSCFFGFVLKIGYGAVGGNPSHSLPSGAGEPTLQSAVCSVLEKFH